MGLQRRSCRSRLPRMARGLRDYRRSDGPPRDSRNSLRGRERSATSSRSLPRSASRLVPIPARRPSSILDLYADPSLDDTVVRVARDPRRKLAADDRLVGPAGACLAAGIRPETLARVIAAALAYGEEGDRQASLRRELEFLEPEEVLSE